MMGEPGPEPTSEQLRTLLRGLKVKASRPAVQTTHDGDRRVHYPHLSAATHVYVRRGKTSPLGPVFDGPFPILERQGTSCIKIQVGLFANGTPRTECQHWQNCKVAVVSPDKPDAVRMPLGRKQNAASPTPDVQQSPMEDPDPVQTDEFLPPHMTTRSGRVSRPPIRFQ